MKTTTIGILATLGLLAVPGIAMAGQQAYATSNVNVRAGPGVDYPVVDIARAGEQVYVYGCLSQRAWCDVDFDGLRGWMSSNYLAFSERGRRYVGPDAMYRMGTPTITFQFGDYWDRHYRSRSFYRDRGRWERPRDRDRWERPRDRDRWERPRELRSEFGIRSMEETRQPEIRAPERERGWEDERRGGDRQRDRRNRHDYR